MSARSAGLPGATGELFGWHGSRYTYPPTELRQHYRGELILETDAGAERYGPGDWYHLAAGAPHAARFEVAMSENEFWFDR